MPVFEVIVKRVSEVSYILEAPNADIASERWGIGTEGAEFIDSEEILSVTNYDDRFADDDYSPEELEDDDFEDASV